MAILGLARRGDPVRDRWWGCHLGDRARHGARVGHVAAGAARACGAPDQRGPAAVAAPAEHRLAPVGAHVTRHATSYLVGERSSCWPSPRPFSRSTWAFLTTGPSPSRGPNERAYDLIAEGFGPGANGGFSVIAVDISRDTSVVTPLAAGSCSRPGHHVGRRSRPLTPRPAWSPAAQPTTSPQDEADQATVARLRSEVFPAVLDGTSATAYVGGQTATFADLGDRVQERILRFVTAVLLLSFLCSRCCSGRCWCR